MIRFRCPACNKSLRIAEDFSDRIVTCPRCEEPIAAPAPAAQPPTAAPDETAGLLPSLTGRGRALVGAVVLAGLLGLVVAVVQPLVAEKSWVSHLGVIVAGSSVVALLACFYGQATNCPACGRWWSRHLVKTEVAERGATAHGLSVTRTEFRCGDCRHRWWVTDGADYPVAEEGATKRSQQ